MTDPGREGTSALTIRMFGPFEVRWDGLPLPRLRSRKGYWLLALLALRHGRDVERRWLAGTLWPDSTEPQSLANLRESLKDLRRALGPEATRLRSPTPHALTLELRGAECDLVAFDEAVTRSDACSLETAVALYRAPLLEDWTEEWIYQERLSREQAYVAALETLASAAAARREPASAVRHLQRVVAVEPLRESAHRALMQSLADAGEYAAATQTYRDLRLLLHRELNAQPAPETSALYQQLRAEARAHAAHDLQSTTGGRSRATLTPAGNRPSSEVGHIPHSLTPLIGRGSELQAIAAVLSTSRLVTLTGAGGVGKTRLALQVAEEVIGEYADGVFFVDLAPIHDPELIVSRIAQVLGVQESRGTPLLESLKQHLRDKQLLLLLDNFEQVLPAAPQISELLTGAPRLKVLVTSRAVLRLRGEKEFPVPPLALPDRQRLPALERLSEYAAVALFIQRAQDARADFAITHENAPAVTEICHRLDGLPLAIELAAARVRVLPPQTLLSRLESRLKLLTGGARDLPARQQTLRDTIAGSYDLLGEVEQKLFRRLSVFVGGCTLEAAEAVCGDGVDSCQLPVVSEGTIPSAPSTVNCQLSTDEVLEGITTLVEQSLLRPEEGPDGEPRLTMLETILEFGRERLSESGEEATIRRRHASFFATLAEVTEPQQFTAENEARERRMDPELSNLRAVLAWSEEQREPALGLRLLVALRWFWIQRNHCRLAHEALTRLLALPEAAERNSLRGRALVQAGDLRTDLVGDYEEVRPLFEESRAIGQELGDQRLVAESLAFRGFTSASRGAGSTAEPLWVEALSIARAVNHRWLMMPLLISLAGRAQAEGDFDKARALLEERLAIVQETGARGPYANTLAALGRLARAQGDPARARALVEEALAIFRETYPGGTTGLLHFLGGLALEEGSLEEALSLYEESRVISQELHLKRSIAAALHGLGRVTAAMGNEEKAWAHYTEGLQRFQELGHRGGVAACVEGMARLRASEGKGKSSARLFGAAAALREAAGARLTRWEQKEVEPRVAELRGAMGDAAFEAAWAEGRAMTLEDAIRVAPEECEIPTTGGKGSYDPHV
jgi:predicted ATPase/DNA-binding SARP family transcriptional activator